MRTIALLSQKGGTGKTTLAINLAVEATREAGRGCGLIDLDPQISASQWGDSRGQESPRVVSCQAARLAQEQARFQEAGCPWVFIDTAPHSESAALMAARASNLILIPCRPAIFDLRAIAATVELARMAGVPACAVLNAVPPRGGLADEAAEALQSYGLAVAPIRITQRAALVNCLTDGRAVSEYEPRGKANQELQLLYRWLVEQTGTH